ncbi:MAG: WG repeat-containing protein [Prevotellaceae bacterium]|nr:WG repeat-containing protein [Prevotellaceae bacterium]
MKKLNVKWRPETTVKTGQDLQSRNKSRRKLKNNFDMKQLFLLTSLFICLVGCKKYDKVFEYHDGLARVGKGYITSIDFEKYGFIDQSGEVVIDIKYDIAHDFQGGLAVVKEENSDYGIIDKTGNTVLPLEYSAIEIKRDYIVLKKRDSGYGIMDKSGKVICPLKYDEIIFSKEGYTTFRQSNGYGVISPDETEKILPEGVSIGKDLFYNKDSVFINGYNIIHTNDKPPLQGMIDYKGNIIIEPMYFSVDNFSDDYARVEFCLSFVQFSETDKNNKTKSRTHYASIDAFFGYYNKEGKPVIRPQFSAASRFSEGHALVSITSDFTRDARYWNQHFEGKVFEYEEGEYLRSGMGQWISAQASLRRSDSKYFINKKGEKVIKVNYEWADDFRQGYAAVKKLYRQYGIIDKTGREVVPCIYETLEEARQQIK